MADAAWGAASSDDQGDVVTITSSHSRLQAQTKRHVRACLHISSRSSVEEVVLYGKLKQLVAAEAAPQQQPEETD